MSNSSASLRTVGLRIAAAAVTLCLLAPVAAATAAATVDLNSATVSALIELSGIGPAKAAAIVEERSVAPFKSIDDLARVRGISDATINELREQVHVSKPKSK
jgi:competence protein ComEA